MFEANKFRFCCDEEADGLGDVLLLLLLLIELFSAWDCSWWFEPYCEWVNSELLRLLDDDEDDEDENDPDVFDGDVVIMLLLLLQLLFKLLIPKLFVFTTWAAAHHAAAAIGFWVLDSFKL